MVFCQGEFLSPAVGKILHVVMFLKITVTQSSKGTEVACPFSRLLPEAAHTSSVSCTDPEVLCTNKAKACI